MDHPRGTWKAIDSFSQFAGFFVDTIKTIALRSDFTADVYGMTYNIPFIDHVAYYHQGWF